ncbi:MAG TPA: hypothetical protein VIL86_05275 [Tepidisphaeraceae bacterium]|jgi:type II secretory pathway pseudopilin PulG
MAVKKSEVRSQKSAVGDRSAAGGRRVAFTLIELMISIALILFLMIGINQVFSTTQTTVSTGQAQAAATRDNQASQGVLANDFRGFASDGPFMVIASNRVYAFRNAADKAGSATPTSPQTVVNPNTGATVTASQAIYGDVNHRQDRVGFFVRGLLNRQTGSLSPNGAIVTNQASSEGWVWIGHLKVGNNIYDTTVTPNVPKPTYYAPAAADASSTDKNDNNAVASQFILGRVAMLLRTNSTDSSGNAVTGYIKAAANPVVSLAPLASGSAADQSPWTIDQSRFDVAIASMDSYRSQLLAYIAVPANSGWWKQFVYSDYATTANTDYRFNCYQFVPKPLTSDWAALAAPIFLPGCGQFMVEYAGDYLTQSSTGAVTAQGPDGVVDFCYDTSATTPAVRTRKVMWYGLPRDTTGDGVISGYTPTAASATTGSPATQIDVVPLRDIIQNFATVMTPAATSPYAAAFEKEYPTKQADYVASGLDKPYTCVWGPSDIKPSMVRITVQLEDANGRLAQGQVYEYVYNLP